MLALCTHVGAPQAAPCFDLGLSTDELQRGERALAAALGSPVEAADVILALSQGPDLRSWPLGQWIELARVVCGGRRVLAISGPAEAEAGRRLAEELAGEARLRSWIGQRGLRELAAALTAAARAGASYVGVDSGPMHLAAACGLSVVALEGPQSHLRTGPWPPPEREAAGARHRVIRSAEHLTCAPCLSRACRHAEGPVCMSRLQPQLVLEALNQR